MQIMNKISTNVCDIWTNQWQYSFTTEHKNAPTQLYLNSIYIPFFAYLEHHPKCRSRKGELQKLIWASKQASSQPAEPGELQKLIWASEQSSSQPAEPGEPQQLIWTSKQYSSQPAASRQAQSIQHCHEYVSFIIWNAINFIVSWRWGNNNLRLYICIFSFSFI